jgi:putative nucleotidyltransferase with HDIG domain
MQVAQCELTPALVIERLRTLPPMPAIVADLLVSIEAPNVSVEVIAGKLGRDQALAARTLRLANSSFFGLRTQAVTMRDAINVLGLRSLRTMVAAAAVVGQLRPAAGSSFNFEGFWRHSIATAVGASQFARHVRADTHGAFMAGLLHDVGRLVLVTCFPAQYDDVIRRRGEHPGGIAAERAVFGLDHVRVGVELARHWNFPALITDAIAAHHDVFVEGPVTLGELVSIADCAARALGWFDIVDDIAETDLHQLTARLGLSAEACEALLQKTREEVESISAILVTHK